MPNAPPLEPPRPLPLMAAAIVIFIWHLLFFFSLLWWWKRRNVYFSIPFFSFLASSFFLTPYILDIATNWIILLCWDSDKLFGALTEALWLFLHFEHYARYCWKIGVPIPRFESGAAGWEAQTLPLCQGMQCKVQRGVLTETNETQPLHSETVHFVDHTHKITLNTNTRWGVAASRWCRRMRESTQLLCL